MVRLVPQPIHGSELLAQYRQTGSPDLFAQIMRAYGGMVFSVCLKVTKDAADAEDASQAAFLTLAVQCKTGATITYLGPWLKKVAKRSALDLVRSRKRRTRRETITAENRPDAFIERAGGAAEQAELSAAIRHELDQLPAKYRMPLVLHYFGGMSHEQIALEMKCTPAALGVRLHRARKMLGKRLEAKNITLGTAALGAAIAASVTHVVSERFIHNTTLAVMGLNAVHVAGVPTAGLPMHLGAVASIVAEVGQSMARARMKMAALALVAGITMLGGAAEAMNHLPDSMRTNLEFLAPSNILKNLIKALTPTPVMRLDAMPPKHDPAPTVVAKAVDTARDYVAPPTPLAPPPSLSMPPTPAQPFLALQVPPAMPPIISGFVPLSSIGTGLHAPSLKSGETLSLPATIDTNEPVVVPHKETTFHVESFNGGGSSPKSESTSIEGFASSGGHGSVTEITDTLPLPDAFAKSQNLTPINTIGPFAVAPTNSNVGTGGLIGPTQADTPTPNAILLGNNQVVVHGGNGLYHWSNNKMGITEGGTNSADFSLEGAVGDGVVTIERLPVTTTLAPARPTGHHFVGIWSIDSTVDYARITLTAHYDESFAEALGLDEKILKLWVYDKGTWIRIMDDTFYRDLINHALTGTYASKPQFFAVSAPEPAGALIVLGAGAYGLLRRRRRP